MDLFDYMAESRKEQESPLAARMLPRTLDEVVGQEEIIAAFIKSMCGSDPERCRYEDPSLGGNPERPWERK